MQVSTPGRICLFGEHQDYLGLPVIAMAISLRAKIDGKKRKDRKVVIHKPDLGVTEYFSLDDLTYSKPRDYFKSGINVCQMEGLTFSSGFDCEVTSQIPIRAGTSSSSAINVSWIHFLSKIADDPVEWNRKKIGELAYKTEVAEFNEPGGMMDQYSTAMGNVIYLESKPKISIRFLNPNLGSFVLGDSGKQKDTLDMLNWCHDSRLKIFQKLKVKNPNFTIQSCRKDLNLSDLKEDEKSLFFGTIKNRDLLIEGLSELEKDKVNQNKIGFLLTQHHQILKDVLQVNTHKIEAMMNAALNAGALGGKINGSGGGGCMFAYAPENPEQIAEAIEKEGGKSYIIHSGEGTKFLI